MTTATNVNENIIQKIQKLLALSQSPNENEAKSAWAKAQRMLIENQLTEQQVLFNKGEKEEFIVKEMSFDKNKKRIEAHKKSLLITIANNNFCEVLFITGTNKCRMFGSENDISMVMFMYAMINVQIENLADISFNNYAYKDITHGTKYKSSYKLGMVAELKRILENATNEVKQENQSFAIMLTTKQERVETFYMEKRGRVRQIALGKVSSRDAYNNGRNDASKVNIRKGITG